MNRTRKFIILIGCLLIPVNLAIASISISNNSTELELQQSEPIVPVQLTFHADAGAPYSAEIDENIIFGASGTYISPIFGATYKWDFGDGTTGYGKTALHSYSEPGVYYPSLKVTTYNGKVFLDDTVAYIDQDNDHLVPYGGCHYSAEVDESISFDASSSVSNDPNSPITQYIWYFGDGEKAYGKHVKHSYDTARVYLVTLEIKDINGNTRHDFLHADVGCDYTSVYDTYLNVDNTLKQVLDLLFNKNNFAQNFLLNLFDVKMYINYNGDESYTDVNSLPVSIDVDGNSVNDIQVNNLEFLKIQKGPSLFEDGSTLIWYQFETTLSSIQTISNDIKIEDDFTICLQVKFGSNLANYLDLDTPLLRIGYNSPAGEEIPDSISITHIFKPYLLPGMFLNNNAQSIPQSQSSQTQPVTQPEQTEIIETGMKTMTAKPMKKFVLGEAVSQQTSEEITIEGEQLEELQLVSKTTQTTNLEKGYYPEYSVQLTSQGGGAFSLVRMFLKSETEDDTGVILKISFDPQGSSSTSSMVFKMRRESGILQRGLQFDIPEEIGSVSIQRIDNGNIKTELTTDLFWNNEKIRKVFWDDQGAYLNFESKVSAGLQNLYFYNQNPEITLTVDEVLFTVSGSFKLSLVDGIDFTGDAGFSLTDLSFTTSNLNGGIIGTLELTISKSVTFGFYKEGTEIGLKIDTDGDINLLSNCIYELNDFDVTLHGDFTFGTGNGEIRVGLDSNKLIFRLERGPSIAIENFHLNVGDLTVIADKLNIGSQGRIELDWSLQEQVTIGLAAGIDLEFVNVNLIVTNMIDFNINGLVNIESNGYITFATDHLETSYSGSLGLSENFRFEINDISVEISGTFDMLTGGIVTVNWNKSQILFSVSQNQELSIGDFHLNVYPFTIDISSVRLHVGGDLQIILNKEEKTFEIGGSFSFEIGGFSFAYEGNTLCSLGGFIVNGGGNFKVSADSPTQIIIDFDRGISMNNLVIEPSFTWNWLLQEFSVGSMSYSGDVYFKLEKSATEGVLEFSGNPSEVEITDFYLNMLNNALKIDFDDLSFDGEFSINLANVNNENSAKLSAYGSFNLFNFDSDMGTIDFDISSINAEFTNSLIINLGDSITPSIQLIGGTQIDILNLDLTVGLWYLQVPEVDIDGNGDLTATWDNDDLTLNINENIQWDIEIDTANLGDWETQGHFNGDVDVTAKKSGDSGFVQLDIYDSGVQYNLKIIHGALTFNLGTFNLDPGTIKFEWQKEQSASNPGYFNILNTDVEGELTAFNVTYDDGTSPVIEIELLNIDFEGGNTYFTWSRTNDNYIEMDRYSTLDCDAFTIKWGSKIFTLDLFNLQTGTFRLEWDFDAQYEKEIKIKNTITSLGPGITYEDLDQDLKISANVGGLNDDYNTVTLRWYKDTSGDVSGVYLDSGGANLANYIQLSAEKGTEGVKLTLGGLKVDGFYIKRDSSGDFEVGGKINLVNTLTFSILKNDDWKDLTVNWDLDLDGIGYVELDADFDFITDEEDLTISAEFEGAEITITFDDLTEYFKFGWDVNFDLQGYLQVDTNGDPLYEVSFNIEKDKNGYYPKWGAYIHGSGLGAEDYEISWDFSKPPGQWVLEESGTITSGQIDSLWVAWNSQWYNVLALGTPIDN